MLLLPIQLKVPRRVISRFKRVAREAFPREAFAYLLGQDAGTLIEVEDLWVPEDARLFTSDSQVIIPPHWIEEAREAAAAAEATVVGDIHSHPFRWIELARSPVKPQAVPSEVDLLNGWTQVSGITCVTESRNGRLRAGAPRFWGPCPALFTEVT